ncbi:phosphate ABC transporter substrate-binding protein PstS [Nostocoides sp. Soil756]|uniref:phosphate ABC transporter substrate-binding protein PstS n=1 Tax=Nostocoides sp. Soil756 TaxID=1736399 RepID=UPI0006FA5F9E|nr:phosphate ABC transporter substrate-binding protein PstS [Tetrasphaera sp. Soil756]KRE60080.1 phosphate ABC transporter substrate-binding protein [Tetrasphaera sp. Soil756]
MKRTTSAWSAVPAALAISLTLTACGAANEDSGSGSSASGSASSGTSVSGTIAGAGASTQTVAQQTWKAGFEGANPDATVNYDPIGSGGGREQFLAGATQFGGSDAYLKDEELAKVPASCGEVIEYPVYVSPIAIAYNLKGVDNLKLDATTLAKIMKGEIKTWDDPAIKALNEGVDLPNTAVVPVHRNDESGTTENFTDYLHAVAPDVWTDKPSGTWPVSGGESAKGTQGVVQAITAGEGYIGYADASQTAKLGNAQIKVGESFQGPSAEAAAKIIDESERVPGRGQYDFAIDIKRDVASEGVYPIVLASYTLACTKYADQKTADLVKAYLSYTVSPEGQKAAADAAGSAPISDGATKNATTAINAISAG